MKDTEFFMKKCLELAKKGEGKVSPNPMVGCIITHNSKIIGKGYHKKYKTEHAEVNAINSVKNKDLLKEADLYVNLEPCSHHGNTPPCSDLIIKYKIKNVYIGSRDIYPEVVKNSSIDKMRREGINVKVGILESKCKELNKRFYLFHEKKRPFIILKWAESKDGFIAPKKQKQPLWLTSKKSKKFVHFQRSIENGIIIGRVTAEKDNPMLNVRGIKNAINPTRIIIDKNLKLSNTLNIFNDQAKTIIVNTVKNLEIGSNLFLKINFDNFIKELMLELYKLNILSVIIEGGSKTLNTFISENIWDEAYVFSSNIILKDGIKAPRIKGEIKQKHNIDTDILKIYKK